MADFTALKTAIQNAIKQNGNEEITGNILQDVLLAIVSTLGDGSINDLITALGSEATTRGNADTTLQQNIDAEAQARQLADSTLQGGINTVSAAITAINNAIGNGCVYAGIATPSSTPASGKVFYLALTAGTYTNYGGLEVSQGINILKNNGSTWSLDSFLGIDDAPTPSSNKLVKSDGVFNDIMTNGSAFDLSAYNNGTTYADLNAALTALNALPAAYKKGGMSMKFVQTSDNKYVQYRLMAQNFTTDVTQWQGVDDEPTAGSDNLVKSGGVDFELKNIQIEIKPINIPFMGDNIIWYGNGNKGTLAGRQGIDKIYVKPNTTYKVITETTTTKNLEVVEWNNSTKVANGNKTIYKEGTFTTSNQTNIVAFNLTNIGDATAVLFSLQETVDDDIKDINERIDNLSVVVEDDKSIIDAASVLTLGNISIAYMTEYFWRGTDGTLLPKTTEPYICTPKIVLKGGIKYICSENVRYLLQWKKDGTYKGQTEQDSKEINIDNDTYYVALTTLNSTEQALVISFDNGISKLEEEVENIKINLSGDNPIIEDALLDNQHYSGSGTIVPASDPTTLLGTEQMSIKAGSRYFIDRNGNNRAIYILVWQTDGTLRVNALLSSDNEYTFGSNDAKVAFNIYSPSNSILLQEKAHGTSVRMSGVDFLVFGDSIASGAYLENRKFGFPELISSHFNMELDNEAVSGSAINPVVEENRGVMYTLSSQYHNFKGIILVEHGTNDYAGNHIIGDVDTILSKTFSQLVPPSTTYNPDYTFAEGFRYTMEDLQRNNPEAVIVVCTSINQPSRNHPNSIGLTVNNYDEAERKICKYLGIKYVDLAYCGLPLYNSDVYFAKPGASGQADTPDGMHPNKFGHSLIAKYLYPTIAGIIEGII